MSPGYSKKPGGKNKNDAIIFPNMPEATSMDTAGFMKYRSIYKIAYIASILMLIVIPLQIAVFALFPMPKSIPEWFALFNSNLVVAFFHSDLFILVNNLLIAIIYLAFYHILKKFDKGLMQIALVLGFIGIAAYLSSNKTFELLALAKAYAATTAEGEKAMLLAAGQTMISSWQGTAFDVYYVLNGIALLIIALLMFRCDLFTRAAAIFGLAAAIFMTIPSTAGTIGLVFSLLSLIPWYVFTIRFALVFRRLGKL